MTKSVVVGISGVTCSGKTTLANNLKDRFRNSRILYQDNYFFPESDPRHVKVPELNHLNWELLSSLDMEKMHSDALKILNEDSTNLLILEGFLLFNFKPIADLCHFKYYFTLPKEECWNRRKQRNYQPPDVPGYFEKIVWPEYLRHKEEITRDRKLVEQITFLDGTFSSESALKLVSKDIDKLMANKNGVN